MQDSFQAQPVIPTKRANGWQTISRAEDVGPNLDLEGISQRQVVGERIGVSADRRFGFDWWHLAVFALMAPEGRRCKLFWSLIS
jgi:hypothetical protein